MTTAQIELPPKLIPIFAPARGDVRYRWAKGGRGSGKSFNFAKMAAIFGAIEPLRILCTRELQDSIKESFHAELKNAIASEPWLAAHYDVGVDYLRGKNGTEFIFKGLRHNIGSIKSMAQIDICIIEEAEDVPEHSWQALEPTIRAEKSEIWVIWNPRISESPVDIRFVKNTPPRSVGAELNYYDNPKFPRVLEEQRAHQERILDAETYRHIWLGQYLTRTKASVFPNNWRVEEFNTPANVELRLGADWGFATDPTTLVRCFLDGRRLFIDYEAYMVGCEIMDTPALFMTVPNAEKWPIFADSSRPETISHMRKHGFPKIMGAVKGPNSVEEGIEWLKSYEIIVHPRCARTIEELTTYSYKTDKTTGAVLPILEDKNNHCIDALRYATEGLRRAAAAIKPQSVTPLPTVSRWR